jgi:uncharacterized hydrophobic protein (TIGR00271 family)
VQKTFRENNHTYEEVYAALRQGSYPNPDFYVLMTLSVIIASFGLLLNSTAIIIGAMLIAPLMDPLLGVAFSSLTRNLQFRVRAIFTIVTGILLGLAISFILGSLFAFMGKTPEILARTQPTTLDLFVALASGFMGGYAKVRRTVSGTIFGVAIAISLIPPLSVVGIGLAYADHNIFLGAGLLFLTNVMSVILSSIFAFMLMEFRYLEKSLRALVFPGLSILVLAIPLSFSFSTLVEKRTLKEELSQALRSDTYTFKYLDIVETAIDPYQSPIRVRVTIRAGVESVTQKQINQVQAFLAERAGRSVQLEVLTTPVFRLEGQADAS